MLSASNVEVVYDDVVVALRGVSLEVPDTGITVTEDFFVGPTAEAYDFQEACYQG